MKKHHATFVLMTLFFTGLIVILWTEYAEIPTNDQLRQRLNLVLPELRDTPPAQVTRLVIEQGPTGGEAKKATLPRIVFERRPFGWQMVEPVDVAADPSRLETLVQNLKTLKKTPDAGTIKESGSRFGLEPPASIVRVFVTERGELAKAPIATLEIGRSIRDKLYVRSSGGPGIEVVDARPFSGMNDPVSSWRDASLFNIPTFQVAALTFSGAGRDLSAVRTDNVWRVLRPVRAVGDPMKVEDALAELTALRNLDGAKGFVADNVRDLAQYGLDEPHAMKVELRPGMGQGLPQSVYVGKVDPARAERIYVRQADQDDVMVVDSKWLKDFGKDPNVLRSQKITDINPALVHYLRIKGNGETFDLSRGANGWELTSPSHHKAEDREVQGFVSRIAELQTSEFLDRSGVPQPGLDTPFMEISLWQLKPRDRPPTDPTAAPKDEATLKLKLGRHDALRKSIYAQVEGDPTILAVLDALLKVLPKNELTFRDRTVLAVGPGEVERFSVQREGREFEVEPETQGNPNRWKLVKPISAPADEEAVTKALLALSSMKAVELISQQPPEKNDAYGFNAPKLVIQWTTPKAPKPQRLIIGSKVGETDTSYAMLSESSLVFTVPDSTFAVFFDEFRNKHIQAISTKQIERLVLRWPDRTLAFAHHPTPSGSLSDWSAEPGTDLSGFDLSRVAALAKDVAQLRTRKFAQDSGAFVASWGLNEPRLKVELYLAGSKEAKVLRVGEPAGRGEYYATVEPGNSGTVFLLSGTGWADLVRRPGELEIPDDVFAPLPGK